MRGLGHWLLWVALMLGGWGAAWAAGPALRVGDAPSHELTRSWDVYEDPGARAGIDDIVQPAAQAQFKPVPQAGPGANFGNTRSALWLRLTLDPVAGSDPAWLLELAYPPLDRVELWAPDEQGRWQRQVAGDLIPFADKPVAHRGHVFPLRLAPDRSTTIYLRLASQGTVSAPTRLWRPAALWQHDHGVYAALSLYFGALIALLLYNLLLFVSVRDRGYLVYVLFVCGMAVAQAALTGLGYQLLWPGQVWWNSVAPLVGVSVAGTFAMLFVREFLFTAARMPRLDKLLLALVVGWLLTLATALLLPYSWSMWMVSVLAVVCVASIVMAGAFSLRRGYPGARFFVLAWAVLLAGAFTLFLHNAGALPSNLYTANSLLIGSALEMILLSFALADRINVSRRFKEQAQARIAAEHAMVEVLRDSQAKLQTVLKEREVILENSLVGIAFLTPQGRLRWANRAMLDIFGRKVSEVTSMEPFYLSREQYLQVGGEVAAAVAQGQTFERELQMQKPDGTRFWVWLSGKAVSRDDLGQGTVWVIMDITERKQLEEQLKTAMSEREAILNSAPVGIVLSVNRTHQWVNERFAQMLGYPRIILIGQSSSHLHLDMQAWERFGQEARMALIAHGTYVCERQLRRRDGELLWVRMGGSCLRPNDPDSGVIWTFLDITDRKQSEAEVQEALERQRTLNELRSRFVAMTSHEFRTPLAAILSAEELLRHYGDRLPPSERGEILDSISAGVQRMSRMLDRVLLIGQADAQMLQFQPGRLDLPSLCRTLVEEARVQQQGSRCQVVAEWGPGVGPGSYDEKLLRHIFGNLLSNAVKYSPQGGLVRLRVTREDEATLFTVSDHGIGIPPDEIGHLFGSFHRASNVGPIPGTGLGLAIVKNAVQMHGGTIEVRSELGSGTTFTVRLPTSQADEPVAA